MRDLHESIQRFNLEDGLDSWRESTVHCKDSAVNRRSNRYVVEYVCEAFPNESVAVFGLALHVESVVLGDASRFVVAAYHCHP